MIGGRACNSVLVYKYLKITIRENNFCTIIRIIVKAAVPSSKQTRDKGSSQILKIAGSKIDLRRNYVVQIVVFVEI